MAIFHASIVFEKCLIPRIPRLVGKCVIKHTSVFYVGEHALFFGKKSVLSLFWKCSDDF